MDFEIDRRSHAAWIGARDLMSLALAFDLAPASLPGFGRGFYLTPADDSAPIDVGPPRTLRDIAKLSPGQIHLAGAFHCGAPGGRPCVAFRLASSRDVLSDL